MKTLNKRYLFMTIFYPFQRIIGSNLSNKTPPSATIRPPSKLSIPNRDRTSSIVNWNMDNMGYTDKFFNTKKYQLCQYHMERKLTDASGVVKTGLCKRPKKNRT